MIMASYDYDVTDKKKELDEMTTLVMDLANHLLKSTDEFMKRKIGSSTPETTDKIINVLFNGSFDFLGMCLFKIADCLDEKGVQRLSLNSISALNNHLHDIKRKEMLN